MKETIIVFLFSWLCAGCTQHTNSALEEFPAQRPNIVWIIVEDISPYLACYGDSTARTPSIDKLAREGVRYTNFFDVSGVCAPSRSCIITGMYPTSIGTDHMRTTTVVSDFGIPNHSVVLPPDVKMFTEHLRRTGYYCTNNDKQDYQFKAPRAGWDESSKTAHWRNRPENKLFFAVFTLGVTHESQIWAKENDTLLTDPATVPLPPYYPDSPVIRKDVARMYSNIMEMDKMAGELLRQLEEDGLMENTIVFFFSDNGGPLPRGKREIYDTGIHIPLIIRFPNKNLAGTVSDELVSFVDLAPTVLSLAGVSLPGYLQGQAFLGSQKSSVERKFVYAARDRMDSEYDMVRAVRDKRFKYIKNFQPEKPFVQNIQYRRQMDLMIELEKFANEGKLNEIQQLWFRKTKPAEELYDLQNDPYELNSLATDNAYSGKLGQLRAELESWMSFTEDKGFIPEKNWIRSFWPDFVQPATHPPLLLFDGTLKISCSTPGASISWQLAGQGDAVDEAAWVLYDKPFNAGEGQKIYAVAERIGYKSSEVKEFYFTNSGDPEYSVKQEKLQQ